MPERRPFKVLVVAPGSHPLAVRDGAKAIAAQEDASVDELHVLLPATMAKSIRLAQAKSGWSSALASARKRFGIAGVDVVFGRRTIHSIGLTDRSGPPTALADHVLEAIRKVCSDPMNEVTVVLSADAGAVGALALAALQLVGRPQDRIFVLEYRAKRLQESAVLVEVPLVLAEDTLAPDQRIHDLAVSRRMARRRLAAPAFLTLDTTRRIIRIDELEIAVPRLQFFWMFCLASLAPQPIPLRKLSGRFALGTNSEVVVEARHPDREQLEALISQLQSAFVALFPDTADHFPGVLLRACGPSPGLPSVVAKLNGRLKKALGIAAAPYLIAGGRGAGGYRLSLPTDSIELATAPHKKSESSL